MTVGHQIPRRWLVGYLLTRAVVLTVLGLLLLLRSNETVRVLAQGLGWVLAVLGVVDLIGGAVQRLPVSVRGLVLARGVVTGALGIALIALTDASLTVVAILAGMQLVVGGGVSILLGVWADDERTHAVRGVSIRGALTVLFGAALIAWPDKSVTAVAIALGVQWMISGFVSTAVAVAVGSRARVA